MDDQCRSRADSIDAQVDLILQVTLLKQGTFNLTECAQQIVVVCFCLYYGALHRFQQHFSYSKAFPFKMTGITQEVYPDTRPSILI